MALLGRRERQGDFVQRPGHLFGRPAKRRHCPEHYEADLGTGPRLRRRPRITERPKICRDQTRDKATPSPTNISDQRSSLCGRQRTRQKSWSEYRFTVTGTDMVTVMVTLMVTVMITAMVTVMGIVMATVLVTVVFTAVSGSAAGRHRRRRRRRRRRVPTTGNDAVTTVHAAVAGCHLVVPSGRCKHAKDRCRRLGRGHCLERDVQRSNAVVCPDLRARRAAVTCAEAGKATPLGTGPRVGLWRPRVRRAMRSGRQ